jgi:serine/threonine-protein kinase
MLTGERLFGSGETTSHVLADVLRAPIDVDKIPAGPLRELLRRCLDRDVKTRLRDIGEARVALSRPLIPNDARLETGTRLNARLAWAVAAVSVIVAGVALWTPWRAVRERPLVRFDVDLGADVALPADARFRSVVISPDGSRLLHFASVSGGPNRLFVRRLDQEKSVEVPF